MTDRSPPSINPTNYGSLTGVLKFVMSKFLQGVDDQLPAQVVSYNRTTNLAQVQPLIAMMTTDNLVIQRAALQSIPVQIDGGGGFFVGYPLKPGDLGYIKANDRDISLFLQSFKATVPNTARKHSFEDAVFVPAVMTGFTIASEDADNMVIQSLDNSVKITLGSDTIKIAAPAINIVSDSVSITSTATSTEFTGNMIVSGDVVISGISFLGHVHGNVQNGPDETGVPV